MKCALRHIVALYGPSLRAWVYALAAGLVLAPAAASATPIGGVLISEVFYNALGGDNGDEWIEIYNGSGSAITLSDYSLGWGRDSYTDGTYVLGSSLAPGAQLLPGQTFVIGGPNSGGQNGNPVYDEIYNFAPDLPNGNDFIGTRQADAVGLFLGDIGSDPTLLPVHSVIYGLTGAVTTLLDEQGNPATVMVTTSFFGSGDSLEYQGGGTFALQPNETPGAPAATVPEAGTTPMMALALVGLLGLARSSRPRALIQPPAARLRAPTVAR
jgi:hypothetical protein